MIQCLFCIGDFVKCLEDGEFGTVVYIWACEEVVDVERIDGRTLPYFIKTLVRA